MRWLSVMLFQVAFLCSVQGAVDVAAGSAAAPAAALPPSEAAHAHWAFQKPKRPSLPVSARTHWGRHEIDAFILEQLEQHGFKPPLEADRATLIRRVALDVIGLPPTMEEIDQFIRDPSADAYERMVDRYLRSPHYGERWARVWLDQARYADSKGYGSDTLRPYMWRYRDWVINAFNQNLPYDQFTIEQLAGDLLPNPTLEQKLATAFHRNSMSNDEGGTDDEEFRVAAVKDRVDTTMQVWMGLTFSCAKCHSHKSDPFTLTDYYSLFAIFNQTADTDLADDSPRLASPTEQESQELDRLRRQLAPLVAQRDRFEPSYTADRLKWEEGVRRSDQSWVVLHPSAASALGGTELAVASTGTVEARGEHTTTNRYHLEFDSLPAGIRSFRLQALPMQINGIPALGRAPDGHLTLNEVQFEVHPKHVLLPQARFVRIQLQGPKRILSLAEVEVFSDDPNIGLKGKPSQSSTIAGGGAELALDAIVNGAFTKGSVTQTQASRDPWWELDLGKEITIDRMAIWSRTDSDFDDALRDYHIELLDTDRQVKWTRSFQTASRPVQKLEFNGVRVLQVRTATVSHSDEGTSGSHLIDHDQETGWRVNSELDQPQEVVFSLFDPLDLNPRDKLVLRIDQSRRDRASLARFQMFGSASNEAAFAVPASVRSALAVPPAERSLRQHQDTGSFYWKFTPQYALLDSQVRPLETELWHLESTLLKTPVMQELGEEYRRSSHVLIRGEFLNVGEPVSPRVPLALHPLPAGSSSNRLGLARWLMDPENPLTARVAVNRMWAILFGRGLVLTQEDFGTQGARPTHPQLLDWLATEYLRLGWDTKALLRSMLVSASYRAASRAGDVQLSRDPQNEWLSHFPRVRLEAEILRDQALSLGGLLSSKMYGPSVFPVQPAGVWQAAFTVGENWQPSEGEDRYRRSLYTFWRRSAPYPSLMAFNAPTREVCTVRRPTSNTPLQALVTLNDPVFVEAAQAFARRIVLEGGSSPRRKVEWAWRRATGRPGETREINAVLRLYEVAQHEFARDDRATREMVGTTARPTEAVASPQELAAWTVVANMILNLDSVLTKG